MSAVKITDNWMLDNTANSVWLYHTEHSQSSAGMQEWLKVHRCSCPLDAKRPACYAVFDSGFRCGQVHEMRERQGKERGRGERERERVREKDREREMEGGREERVRRRDSIGEMWCIYHLNPNSKHISIASIVVTVFPQKQQLRTNHRACMVDMTQEQLGNDIRDQVKTWQFDSFCTTPNPINKLLSSMIPF